MSNTLEPTKRDVFAIAEYLGCNEKELWSEVSKLLQRQDNYARIDTAKTIQEITQERFINDMQLVDIYRDKDNKVISINNTVCQNYIDRLTQQKKENN